MNFDIPSDHEIAEDIDTAIMAIEGLLDILDRHIIDNENVVAAVANAERDRLGVNRLLAVLRRDAAFLRSGLNPGDQ